MYVCIFPVCACMCMPMCVWECMCVYTLHVCSTRVRGRKEGIRSLWAWGLQVVVSWHGVLGTGPRFSERGPLSHLTSLQASGFYLWVLGVQNSGPHTYVVNPLLTEPSPIVPTVFYLVRDSWREKAFWKHLSHPHISLAKMLSLMLKLVAGVSLHSIENAPECILGSVRIVLFKSSRLLIFCVETIHSVRGLKGWFNHTQYFPSNKLSGEGFWGQDIWWEAKGLSGWVSLSFCHQPTRLLPPPPQKTWEHLLECVIYYRISRYKEIQTLGWRDGSVTRSTSCSLRGPRFDSQRPCSSS